MIDLDELREALSHAEMLLSASRTTGRYADVATMFTAARAYLAMMEGAEEVWVCEFGTIISCADENGDCQGCSGRQAVRGCGPRLLVTPEEET